VRGRKAGTGGNIAGETSIQTNRMSSVGSQRFWFAAPRRARGGYLAGSQDCPFAFAQGCPGLFSCFPYGDASGLKRESEAAESRTCLHAITLSIHL